MFMSEEAHAEMEAAHRQESMTQGEYMQAAVAQYASVYGEEDKERAWILSPFDTWEKNPHYTGPAVPDPETAMYEYEVAEMEAADAAAATEQPFEEMRWSHVEDDSLPF
jgi:hypothetical protein